MKARDTPLSVHEELLTVQEVAAEYRVHPETVRRWVRNGDIEGVLVGGFRVKVRRSQVSRQFQPVVEKTDVDTHNPGPGAKAADGREHEADIRQPDAPVSVGDHPAAGSRKRGRHKNRW